MRVFLIAIVVALVEGAAAALPNPAEPVPAAGTPQAVSSEMPQRLPLFLEAAFVVGFQLDENVFVTSASPGFRLRLGYTIGSIVSIVASFRWIDDRVKLRGLTPETDVVLDAHYLDFGLDWEIGGRLSRTVTASARAGVIPYGKEEWGGGSVHHGMGFEFGISLTYAPSPRFDLGLGAGLSRITFNNGQEDDRTMWLSLEMIAALRF